MGTSFFDFQIIIASPNGSGSLTANRLLHKALFREGFHTVGKNIFPSNIEGLPTYYSLRLSESYNSLKSQNDLYLGLNPQTFKQDLASYTTSDSLIFFNQDQKFLIEDRPKQFSASFRTLGKDIEAPIKTKKRISNLYYVGWTAALLGLKPETFKTLLQETFTKTSVADLNFQAFQKGYELFHQEHAADLAELMAHISTLRQEPLTDHIFIEGNQATALGWVDAGCTVATWYPITPSSSVVESFEKYVDELRPKSPKGQTHYAVIQAEDEISAVCAVVGANWAGARAATATSGPGLSLMNEAIGLAYFAEIPSVVWDIQRVGPSTGLPTRTSQGDLLSAYYSSHGDTFHPVLLPSTVNECYSMAFKAFEVSEYYQTPVFVLSDLDLGMNAWVAPQFNSPSARLDRGKVLSEIDLESLPDFQRYLGDEEGVPSRTLPGTHHKLAPYMTRGSGHDTNASYSENPKVYENKLERLKTKVLNTRNRLPKPRIAHANNPLGLMYYGTTAQIFPEIFNLLSGYKFDLCEIKSLPLHQEALDFATSHEQIIVIEQNRDLQMLQILKAQVETTSSKMTGVNHYGGWPIQAEAIAEKIKTLLNAPPPPQNPDPEVPA